MVSVQQLGRKTASPCLPFDLSWVIVLSRYLKPDHPVHNYILKAK